MHSPAYSPNPAADARAVRIIRALLCACLLAPVLFGCATSLAASDSARHEHAEPTRLTAVK